MVFADMQMPMPVGGTQPKEGALAKLGGSDRCVERGVPDRLRRALSDRTGERAGLCGGRHGRKPGDRARLRASAPDGRERSDLADSRVRQQGHRHLQPRVVEQVQNGRHAVVRPNDVEDDASPAGPHVMLEPPLT